MIWLGISICIRGSRKVSPATRKIKSSRLAGMKTSRIRTSLVYTIVTKKSLEMIVIMSEGDDKKGRMGFVSKKMLKNRVNTNMTAISRLVKCEKRIRCADITYDKW